MVKCAETKYLSSFGDYIEKNLSVIEGDVIRGDYKTYNSPFYVGISWEYLGVVDVLPNFYESGWFEITISSGSGIITVVLMNSDSWAGGYIEYTITNPKAEAREQEAVIMLMIIGVVIAIISVGVIAGIAVHFKNKNRKIEELEQELKEAPKKIYCRECGAEILDKEGTFCSKCGHENN